MFKYHYSCFSDSMKTHRNVHIATHCACALAGLGYVDQLQMFGCSHSPNKETNSKEFLGRRILRFLKCRCYMQKKIPFSSQQKKCWNRYLEDLAKLHVLQRCCVEFFEMSIILGRLLLLLYFKHSCILRCMVWALAT